MKLSQNTTPKQQLRRGNSHDKFCMLQKSSEKTMILTVE